MKKTNIWNTAGFYAVVLYIFMTYIPQLAIHKIFYNKFLELYHGTQNPASFVVFTVFFFIFIIILLDSVLPKVNLKIRQDTIQKTGSFLATILVIIYFASSLYFFKHFGLDFRQSKSLSEGGLIVKILWFVRMFGEFYVFYIFASVVNGNKLTYTTKLKLFIVVLSWGLSLTGSLQFLLILICILLIFTPYKKQQNMFISKRKNISLFKTFSVILLSIPIIITVVFLGFANKIGVDKAIDMFTDTSLLSTIFSHIALRMSTSYTSVLIMSHDHLFDIPLQIDTYLDAIQTFLNRLGSITHVFDYPLNGFKSVNRTNYLLLFIPNFHPRAGASPGLLASIYYIPIFPFNFLIMGAFVLMIIRATNKYIIKPAKELTLLSKLIIVYFIFPLFESPLNMLSIIEPAFFYFLVFVLMSYFPPIPQRKP